MATLTYINGPHDGKKVKLEKKTFNIGITDKANIDGKEIPIDLIIDFDVTMSRLHCFIEHEDDRYVLRELKEKKSTNGTWVNNEKVEDSVGLNNGDFIRMSKTVMQFHL